MFTSLWSSIENKQTKIAIVGLGYVGLPLAVEFGKHFDVIGFDISVTKIEELQKGIDRTGELSLAELNATTIDYTTDARKLAEARILIVTVPTPIDDSNNPDLTPVKKATELIGKHLQSGSIIVYESTVYPGVTEDFCVPILEKESGLQNGAQFKMGYSPERINPGDKEHTLTKITKIVSGQDQESLSIIAKLYGRIIKAGIYEASSIKVAEAAKVIENTQRDLNIALMNELAVIFNKIGINTVEVIEAAATKWNFIKMFPGLVGGHCIGVDPYYLTHKAEMLGYTPQVILAGRRINNSMGKYIAEQAVKMLIKADRHVKDAKVLVLGFTFKENVSDIRNTRVIDIVNELNEYGITVFISDPHASSAEAEHEYGVQITEFDKTPQVDAIILASPHAFYRELSLDVYREKIIGEPKVFVDVKGVFRLNQGVRDRFFYWNL